MSFASIKSVCIALFASLVFFASDAKADDITIVTHRHADWTELYVSADAETMFNAFSVFHTELTGADDSVEFGALRTGTAWLGDRLLEGAEVSVSGAKDTEDSEFVATSFMVHPKETKLPMTTPLEGMIAIGVCNGPEDGTFVSIGDLHSYVGYFANVGSLDAPIEIRFAQEGGAALTVRVYDFDQSGEIASYTQTVGAGELLTLKPAPTGGSGFFRLFTSGLSW